MTKIIKVRLVSIRYEGDTIGNDIVVKVNSPGFFKGSGEEKKVKRGRNNLVNKEVGQFVIDQKELIIPLRINVTEKDLRFSDIGKVKAKIKVNLKSVLPQKSIQKVEVKERRRSVTKAKATFYITLEILVIETIRYVAHIDQGWLTVKNENSGPAFSIPEFLNVQLYHVDETREYFSVIEGQLRGTKASVKLDNDGSSFLITRSEHTKPVNLTYSTRKKTLKIGSSVFITKDYPSMPWKKGLYDIEIPDAPHRGGQSYPEAKYAVTWFRVGHDGERYIHTGRNSLGCITVTERERWDELYNVLIRARSGDKVSVGILEVTD